MTVRMKGPGKEKLSVRPDARLLTTADVLSDSRRTIDRRPEPHGRCFWLRCLSDQGITEGHSWGALWAEEGEAGMTATDVEYGRAAVLWLSRPMAISIGGRVCQMPLRHQMNGALQNFGSPWQHGQDQKKGIEFIAPDSHGAIITQEGGSTNRWSVGSLCKRISSVSVHPKIYEKTRWGGRGKWSIRLSRRTRCRRR